MKRTYQVALAVTALMGTAVLPAFANGDDPRTATGNAVANVAAALKIVHVQDSVLNFGEFALVNGYQPGNITINAQTGIVDSHPNIVLFSADQSRDLFQVSGKAGKNYTVTLPASITLNRTGGGASMTIVPTKHNIGTLSDPNGLDDLFIGGTLTVNANQMTGEYTGQYDVTVDLAS